jgi:hypothetical protein
MRLAKNGWGSRAAGAGLVALVLARAGSAAAADGKVLDPAACVDQFSQPTEEYDYSIGKLTTTEGRNFMCSLEVDNTSNTSGLTALQVAVSSATIASGDATSCEAASVDRFGNVLVRRFVSADGPNYLIDFGTSINSSVGSGHYELTCTLDPSGELNSIFYEEPSATNTTGDAKVVGSASCLPWQPHAFNWEYSGTGLINEVGTSPVTCGLDRINVNNTNGLQSLKVSIFDPTGTMTCTADSYDRFGVLKLRKTKTTPGTGNQVIDFGSTLNVSVSHGYYTVSCQLPQFAQLNSIYYREPLP